MPENPSGTMLLIKGKRYLLVDEVAFARIEQAVNRLKTADAYIKKLEAERAGIDAVLGMQSKLDKINDEIRLMNVELLAAKNAVIDAADRATAAVERENKVLAEQNSDLKTQNKALKKSLNKSRLLTVLTAIGAGAALILR